MLVTAFAAANAVAIEFVIAVNRRRSHFSHCHGTHSDVVDNRLIACLVVLAITLFGARASTRRARARESI